MDRLVSIKRKALPVAMATACMSIAGFTACLWSAGCTDQQRWQTAPEYYVAAYIWPRVMTTP